VQPIEPVRDRSRVDHQRHFDVGVAKSLREGFDPRGATVEQMSGVRVPQAVEMEITMDDYRPARMSDR
jgi:hypothetical protein